MLGHELTGKTALGLAHRGGTHKPAAKPLIVRVKADDVHLNTRGFLFAEILELNVADDLLLDPFARLPLLEHNLAVDKLLLRFLYDLFFFPPDVNAHDLNRTGQIALHGVPLCDMLAS